MNGRQPVDIAAPVLVAATALLLAVGLAFWLGAIPRALAAAAFAAPVLVVLLFALPVVEHGFALILVLGALLGHFSGRRPPARRSGRSRNSPIARESNHHCPLAR